jgi:hypothetical protein
MRKFFFIVPIIVVALVDCSQPKADITIKTYNHAVTADTELAKRPEKISGHGALLLTNFRSFEELKSVIQFKYVNADSLSKGAVTKNSEVQLTYDCAGHQVTSTLKAGVSEADFLKARDGNVWDKVKLMIHSPYAVVNRNNLKCVEFLGRKRPWMFGKGDAAFYDLAETMVYHISEEDMMLIPSEDLSEKGYLNTFNHILAQAFMTSIFSERLADFVADVHERHNMPELITGIFTKDQLNDLEKGPVDNYIDMINNEWGQDLGKLLRSKYAICRNTYWTPDLLADYLNDVQSYHSWAFQIGFVPFRATDDIVINFAKKMNTVLKKVPELQRSY